MTCLACCVLWIQDSFIARDPDGLLARLEEQDAAKGTQQDKVGLSLRTGMGHRLETPDHSRVPLLRMPGCQSGVGHFLFRRPVSSFSDSATKPQE